MKKKSLINPPLSQSNYFPFIAHNLLALAVSLGSIVTLVNNQILRAVVLTTGEVRVENVLGTLGVADLGIDGGTRHVGDHGVTTAPGGT